VVCVLCTCYACVLCVMCEGNCIVYCYGVMSCLVDCYDVMSCLVLSCDTNHVYHCSRLAWNESNQSIIHRIDSNRSITNLFKTSQSHHCGRRVPCRTVRYGTVDSLDWIGLDWIDSLSSCCRCSGQGTTCGASTHNVRTYIPCMASIERKTNRHESVVRGDAMRCVACDPLGLDWFRFDSIRLHLNVVRYGSTRDSTHVPHPALFALPHGAVRCDAIRTVWFVFVPENDETVRKEFR